MHPSTYTTAAAVAQLGDAFARVQTAASLTNPSPTPAQKLSGEYRKGRVGLHGLTIDIENVRGSMRNGTSPDGVRWSNRMAAHYGDFPGTMGNDGDAVDVFIGLFPESCCVWVINQRHVSGQDMGFDEHKVVMGCTSEQQAYDAYTDSFDRGWRGLSSIVRCSITQLKWWLSHGDKSRLFSIDQLPLEGTAMLDKVLWNADAQPVTTPLHKLMYDLRVHDKDEGLLLDAATMEELMAHPDIEDTPVFDALVVQVARMQQKMDLLQRVMESAGEIVKPTDMTISDPVRARGVMQVMVLFAMNDGQTISVWFHNPDTTPAKLTPMDDLISWKWMLNKKDVTIVVAPERGKDLNIREVARRVMRLVERNSEAFKKANVKLSDRVAQTEAVKGEIAGLEAELSGLQHRIEVAQQVNADTPPVAAKVIEPEAASPAVGNGAEDAVLSAAGVAPDVIAAMNDDGGYAAILASEKLSLKWADVLDSAFGKRIISVRNALRELNWVGTGTILQKTIADKLHSVGHQLIQAGAGKNVVGVIWHADAGTVEVADSLHKLAADFAAEIDASVKAPAADEPKYDPDVVSVYATKSGKEALIIRETTSNNGRVSYSYNGAYGAGSGVDYATMLADVSGSKQAHPGMKLVFGTEFSELAPEAEADASAIVDAAYKFASATDAFKEYVADSVEDADYSTFASAKAMDLKAIELGCSIAWDVSTAVLDSVEAADEDDFDAEAEFDAVPELDANGNEIEAVMDGDFKGHPFRGNQHKASSHESGAAVGSSMRAKHAERKGDAKGATKAHASAHYSHKAAAVSASGKAKKYHTKMAAFHGGRAGVLDSVLDGVAKMSAQQEVKGFARQYGLKVEAKSGTVSLSNNKTEWMEVFEGWDDALVFLRKARKDHLDGGKKWVFDGVLDAAEGEGFEYVSGVISKDGAVAGRAYIGGDGKAMVYVGAEGLERVTYVSTLSGERRSAMWSDDDAADMVGHLFAAPVAAKGDISYRATGDMFTTFYPDSAAGEGAWKIMNANPDSVGGKVLTQHVGSVIAQLEAAGYTVTKDAAPAISDDDLLKALNEDAPAPAETDATRLNAIERAAPKGAITSDDPQAIDKLQAKLAALLAQQEFMKKANKFFKAKNEAELLAMGLTQGQIDTMKKGDFAGRIGFADYLLTNNNGVIGTTRKRLESMMEDRLKQQQAEPASDPFRGDAEIDRAATEGFEAGKRGESSPPEWLGGDELLLSSWNIGVKKGAEAAAAEARLAVDLTPAVVAPVDAESVIAAEAVKLASADDTAYLQTLINGSADMFAADILERLEPMFTQYEGDATMMGLLNQAAEAYSAAAVKAAQTALAS